jgi:Notch-like protein
MPSSTCPPGWASGEAGRCLLDVDECESNPCEQFEQDINDETVTPSQCFDYIDSYVCICEDGWDGENCAENIDDCASNPCSNGDPAAICTDLERAYTCQCVPGWEGENCELQIDPCDDDSSIVDDCDKNLAHSRSGLLETAICAITGPGEHSCTCVDGY